MAKVKVRNIPISQVKWIKKISTRREKPASWFLDPKNDAYPDRNDDGSYNCNLIRAAITRAGQYKKLVIMKKAQTLYEKLCK